MSGNPIGTGRNRTGSDEIEDDGPFAGMRWVPYVIGIAVCLSCVCIVALLLILRSRRRKAASRREQERATEINMHDLPEPGSTRGSDFLKAGGPSRSDLHDDRPFNDPVHSVDPVQEVHIEWVNDSVRESSIAGYQALPVNTTVEVEYLKDDD